jgi:hypothetical protein
MERVIPLPIFDEIAGSLKQKGSYSKELSEQEVVQIMEGLREWMLSNDQEE